MTGGCASPAVCGRTAVCLLQLEESVHSWGLRACVCVCLGKQQWLGRGLWERAIKTNAVPPVMQVDGAGRLPLANRHLVKVTFPKKAMTHGTPSPPGLCYSTGKRANGLALDISVWGGWGMKAVVCGVGPLSVEVNLFFSISACLCCCVFSSPAPPQHLFLKPLHTQTHTRPHTHRSLSVDTSLCLPSCLRTSVSQYVWHSDCVWWLNWGDRLLTGPVPERSMPTGEICENMPCVISSPFPWQLHSVKKPTNECMAR